MTREEQIKQEAEEQAKELYCDKHNLKWMFKHGVAWADEHPKSQYNLSDADFLKSQLEGIIDVASRTTSGNVAHNIANIKYLANMAINLCFKEEL